MLISIRLLNHPGAADVQLEVSPVDKIQDIKSRIAEQIKIPINQQKLVLRGKPLHDGLVRDHQIIDGTKLHLIITSQQSTILPMNNELINELRLLAVKLIANPNERESFITAFQMEMKNAVDQLNLDDIEKLCTDRLNRTV